MKSTSAKIPRTNCHDGWQSPTFLHHCFNGGYGYWHAFRRIILCLPVYVSLICSGAYASPFELTFTPSTSETSGIVASYSMWIQATNAPDTNQWQWIGQCQVGQTNIIFDSSRLMLAGTTNVLNPCWVTVTAEDANNVQSAYATSILFDTNSPVFAGQASSVPRLLPPVLLSIQKL